MGYLGSKSTILVRFSNGLDPCDRMDLAHHAQWSKFFFWNFKFFFSFFMSLKYVENNSKTKMPSNIFRFEASFFHFLAFFWPKFDLIKNIFILASIELNLWEIVGNDIKSLHTKFEQNRTKIRWFMAKNECTVVEFQNSDFRKLFSPFFVRFWWNFH